MKKYLLIVSFISAAVFTANAQEYKPVKVGLGLGYASPGGDGAKGGVLLYLEPAYRVNDALAIGLRLETAIMVRGATFTSGGTSVSSDAEAKANASYTVNGQYYFSNNTFRPFAGIGLGMYSLASASVSVSSGGSSTSSASADASKFGFYPRLGFDLGHFTMQVEYNIIPATSTEYTVSTGGTGTSVITSESKNSYLGIKAGFFISGGKK
ncbi:MAG TPA: outer membrane beta-barrel protein [Cyclobacteriaceae bacterium]|jgi:outer membrane protein W|nr:outer membrane beta-barrel protein [Cyclobacteriaceae bacterium]